MYQMIMSPIGILGQTLCFTCDEKSVNQTKALVSKCIFVLVMMRVICLPAFVNDDEELKEHK